MIFKNKELSIEFDLRAFPKAKYELYFQRCTIYISKNGIDWEGGETKYSSSFQRPITNRLQSEYTCLNTAVHPFVMIPDVDRLSFHLFINKVDNRYGYKSIIYDGFNEINKFPLIKENLEILHKYFVV